MKMHNLMGNFRTQFVDSLHFEEDQAFRLQMGRLIHRTMDLVGTLGPLAVAIYLIGQIGFLGKAPSWVYDTVDTGRTVVLWDKLAMVLAFLFLLPVRRLIPEDRPIYGRLAIAFSAVVVVIAITLDDVAVRSSQFTPAYVTLVILFLAGAVPMQPISMLVVMALVVGAGYLSVTVIPPLFGLMPLTLGGEFIVFLVIIAVISTAASSLLYNLRHEEFLARKSAEDLSRELAESNAALERAIRDLRTTQDRLIYVEKMASLGRFATGVAHEMRNPLNFILNFSKLSVEILEDSEATGAAPHPDSEDLRVNLERIHTHATRAEEIVKSLISHSQQRSSQPARIDLNRLIKEQTSVLSRRYDPDRSGHSVRLVLDLDETVGHVEALPAELTYAIDNVVDNAYRAVVDRARADETDYQPEIVIKTARENDTVRIEILDNGVGMDTEQTGKIFEPFYTTRPAGSGTGLGLASAYSAITGGHGGTISVASTLGSGSVFTIELGDFPH